VTNFEVFTKVYIFVITFQFGKTGGLEFGNKLKLKQKMVGYYHKRKGAWGGVRIGM